MTISLSIKAFHDKYESQIRLITLVSNLIARFHRDKTIKSHSKSTSHHFYHALAIIQHHHIPHVNTWGNSWSLKLFFIL